MSKLSIIHKCRKKKSCCYTNLYSYRKDRKVAERCDQFHNNMVYIRENFSNDNLSVLTLF